MSPKPTTVAQYITSAPKEAQPKLREMQKTIRSVAPRAIESIKWSMPSFSHKRILVIFGAFKNHIGFYPGPGPIKAMEKELSKYKFARGSIQFPLDKPLPLSLIKKITKLRIKESIAEDVKWKLNK